MEESASKLVKALKTAKDKDEELQALCRKLSLAENQVADLTRTNQELSSSMAKAEGTLQRAATLSGLDANVRQEFNEVSDVQLSAAACLPQLRRKRSSVLQCLRCQGSQSSIHGCYDFCR